MSDDRGIEVAPDLWLSDVLGRPVFTVSGAGEDAEALARAVAARGPGFFHTKVPADEVATVHALCRAGFGVVDVNVTFELRPEAAGFPATEGLEVSDCRPEEAEAVLAIAGSCFRTSRFHLDPAIPRTLADRVKREWVKSYIRGARGDRLLVARGAADRPIGFLAALRTMRDGRRAAVIDLIGVAREEQRRRAGEALVRAFVAIYRGECEMLLVGTQIANVASVAFYEKLGFRLLESRYVLHRHVAAVPAAPDG